MLQKVTVDASPIIFLSKSGFLEILNKLFSTNITVIQNVANEVNRFDIPPDEEKGIKDFLEKCHIVKAENNTIKSSSLSETDSRLLTYSTQNHFDLIITDDNLVRKIANYEKISSTGTLGILLKSVEKKLLNPENAIKVIDDLIENHNFRISVNIYRKALHHLNSHS